MIKEIIQQLTPPFIWRKFSQWKKLIGEVKKRSSVLRSGAPSVQDLDVYWDSNMASVLETWGEGNVWNEIQLLMVNCRGKVLDIACGTGKTMELIRKFDQLDVYGCDISDFLISKAIQRGIKEDHLLVGDATKMKYQDNYFDYAYSIGSLEHFTEDGIASFLSECCRIVNKMSFHMVPVSRSGNDEGWLKTYQSFHNNSAGWWLGKYTAAFRTVYVLDSVWHDDISVGKWFVCIK